MLPRSEGGKEARRAPIAQASRNGSALRVSAWRKVDQNETGTAPLRAASLSAASARAGFFSARPLKGRRAT